MKATKAAHEALSKFRRTDEALAKARAECDAGGPAADLAEREVAKAEAAARIGEPGGDPAKLRRAAGDARERARSSRLLVAELADRVVGSEAEIEAARAGLGEAARGPAEEALAAVAEVAKGAVSPLLAALRRARSAVMLSGVDGSSLWQFGQALVLLGANPAEVGEADDAFAEELRLRADLEAALTTIRDRRREAALEARGVAQ